LSESQWIDVGTGGMDAAIAKLVEAVRRHLDPSVAIESHAHLDRSPVAPQRKVQRARWMVAGGAILLVALAYFAVDKVGLSRHGAEQKPLTAMGPAATGTPAAQTGSAVFAPPPHSIAVLPFVNMSGDASQEYFSDGISEELLNSLSRLNELQVVARTSSFSFKGQNVDASTIAHKLNVGTILEGSVRRAGKTVRITVQVIDAVTGFQVWSQTYDQNLSDILKVQTEVATAVAQQLQVRLVGDAAAKLEIGGTTNPEAYDAYLKGEQLYSRARGGEVWRSALAFFDQAIALDPNYASAHAGRARALGHAAIFVAPPGDRASMRDQALAAAERAVAIAPSSGEAHSVLGTIRAFGLLDFRGAAPELDRAIALAPGNAQVQRRFGSFYSLLGHHEQAMTAARRAIILDPQNVLVHVDFSRDLRHAHRFDESLRALDTAAALSPDSHYIEAELVDTLLEYGATERAQSICASSVAPIDDGDRYSCLAKAYHVLGRQMEAKRELEKLKALEGDRMAYEYARIYSAWGDKEAALAWLTKAEQLRDPAFQSLRVDSSFDPIRSEPQFKAIEARLNFPP
jgi:TolB-like protein/Flp pilus assembly protein TadD